MSEPKKIATLEPRLHWSCPSCRCSNYTEETMCSPEELLEEEEGEQVLRTALGLDEWQEIPDDLEGVEISTIPDDVTCLACGEEFETDMEVGTDE